MLAKPPSAHPTPTPTAAGAARTAPPDAAGSIVDALPGEAALRRRAATENFPVALRVLPAAVRGDLHAVYGFARLADEVGDSYPGDRVQALDWLEADLMAAVVGSAAHPAVARLSPLLRRHPAAFAMLRDLVTANRRDQHQTRYTTFDDLLDYCTYSANPVGRLVLTIFGVDCDDDIVECSDDVCSGLQVAEHLQDVAEDYAAGRVYLPTDDLDKFGCTAEDLAEPVASADVRRLIAFEVERARRLLASGSDLVGRLPPQPRLAVAGFVAGGHAALDAITDAGFDVLARRCRPSKRRLLRHAAGLLLRSPATQAGGGRSLRWRSARSEARTSRTHNTSSRDGES